jgi:HD-like signal output (HDOD) protein
LKVTLDDPRNPPNFTPHCRRVAAVASELARRAGLPLRDQEIALDAGLIHHYPPELRSLKTIAPLLAARPGNSERTHPTFVRYVMDTIHALAASDPTTFSRRRQTLPDIISVAHVMVDEAEAYLSTGDGDPREAMFKRLRRRVEEGLHAKSTFQILVEFPRPSRRDAIENVCRLPVFPAVALKVLRHAAGMEANFQTLASLALQDQTLSGHLISAANSCLYGPVARISTLAHAMSFIGLEETRRVLTAAAMRPLFASAKTAELWHHSLRVARWCEAVAVSSKDESFLAGLVHDVGRLMMATYSTEASTTVARLVERGCDSVFAETLVFGCDHGGLGADVLRYWSFPETLSVGVAHHHRPERSASGVSSLLFLAESQFPGEEASPAPESMRHALDTAGVRSDLADALELELGPLAALTVAA